MFDFLLDIITPHRNFFKHSMTLGAQDTPKFQPGHAQATLPVHNVPKNEMTQCPHTTQI